MFDSGRDDNIVELHCFARENIKKTTMEFEYEKAKIEVIRADATKSLPVSEKYDVVFMDIQMPKLGGYESSRIIREFEDTKKAHIPIIAITANAFDEDRKQAFESGMNGHIAKPINVPVLFETIKQILKSNQ